MSARLGAIDAGQVAALRGRHPRAFGRTAGERARLWAVLIGLVGFVAFCLVRFDVRWDRIVKGLGRAGHIAGGLVPPTAGEAFWDLLQAMLESVGMAFLGTVLAAAVAVPLGFLGARNVVASRLLRFPVRRSFDFLRGVDALVWALVYVRAVGLGPLAGVLAIATTDVGIFAKLFAEAIENVDRKQVEGVRAAGGNAIKTARFGILPQVLPIMLSNVLYLFESNSRSATILGIIGAGGIGFALSDRIRAHRWEEVGFIIILITVVVALIDFLSHLLRTRVIKAGLDRPLLPPADPWHRFRRPSHAPRSVLRSSFAHVPEAAPIAPRLPSPRGLPRGEGRVRGGRGLGRPPRVARAGPFAVGRASR